MNIFVDRGKPGADTFPGISISGTYYSEEQEEEREFGHDEDFPDLQASSMSYFFHGGTLFAQFELFNNSSVLAYDFTAMQIYDGLDLAFFNSVDFASPAAIASGVLALDVLAVTSFARLPRVDPDPLSFSSLVLSVPGIDPTGYQLVVGFARPISLSGEVGEPAHFAFATTVPGPPSLILLGLGAEVACAGAFGRWRGRRRARRRSPGGRRRLRSG